MKRLFFPDNGFLCEVIPSEKFTIDNMKVGKDIPENVVFEKVEHDSLPSQVLREAWKLNGALVDIDIPKGKEVAHKIRREARDKALSENIELIKLDASGIPLKTGQSATTAKNENATYMLKDDKAQEDIDSANNEADLLEVLNSL